MSSAIGTIHKELCWKVLLHRECVCVPRGAQYSWFPPPWPLDAGSSPSRSPGPGSLPISLALSPVTGLLLAAQLMIFPLVLVLLLQIPKGISLHQGQPDTLGIPGNNKITTIATTEHLLTCGARQFTEVILLNPPHSPVRSDWSRWVYRGLKCMITDETTY